MRILPIPAGRSRGRGAARAGAVPARGSWPGGPGRKAQGGSRWRMKAAGCLRYSGEVPLVRAWRWFLPRVGPVPRGRLAVSSTAAGARSW